MERNEVASLSNWANIGTFVLTVVILIIMVRTSPSSADPVPQASHRWNLGIMGTWIMPSILAAAVLGAAILNFVAHHRIKTVEAQIPSIMVNNIPVAGPAKVAADKALRKIADASRMPQLSQATIAKIELAGILKSKAGQAEWLAQRLEKVWHIYNNDKSSKDGPLIYPLSASSLPEAIKEHRHKELFRFYIHYTSHIGQVKAVDQSFHSSMIDDTIPSKEEYLDVKKKIEAHAALLRKRAESLLRSVDESLS
jgi:hypothetical protein